MPVLAINNANIINYLDNMFFIVQNVYTKGHVALVFEFIGLIIWIYIL